MWLLIGPLVLILLYAAVYAVIFRVRPAGLTEAAYVVHVIAGLLPFLGFAAALNLGASSLAANRQILLNTVFPAELIPLRALFVGFGTTAMGLVLTLLVGLLVLEPSPAWLAVPALLVLMMMFVAGIVWLLSLLNLAMRDVQQLLQPTVLVLLIITPIAYTESMVPAALAPVIYLNPLAYYVMGFQQVLVTGALPGVHLLVVMVTLSVISFCGAFAVFNRVKRVVLDYV